MRRQDGIRDGGRREWVRRLRHRTLRDSVVKRILAWRRADDLECRVPRPYADDLEGFPERVDVGMSSSADPLGSSVAHVGACICARFGQRPGYPPSVAVHWRCVPAPAGVLEGHASNEGKGSSKHVSEAETRRMMRDDRRRLDQPRTGAVRGMMLRGQRATARCEVPRQQRLAVLDGRDSRQLRAADAG